MIQAVYVESSSRCNLSCAYCFRTGRNYPAKNRDLEPELFAKLVGDLGQARAELLGQGRPDLFLHSFGEPTLNPALEDMVRLAARSGLFGGIRFVSNLLAVSPARYHGYFQAGLTGLYVSLDTLRPEAIAATRRGTDLPLLLARLEELAAAHAPRLCVISVLTHENKAELPRLAELLLRLAIPTWNIQLLNTHAGGFGLEAAEVAGLKADLLARCPGMTVNFEEQTLLSCAQPFTTLAVNALGYLVPCCSMTDHEVTHFGNIAERPLGELYFGEPYAAFRQGFRKERPKACENCPYY